MALFEIRHRFTGLVLFSLETESLKLCVEAAVKSRADLSRSNLRGSDLRGSDLRWSDLSRSDLSRSDLSRSDLRGSNLRGSDLRGSDLRGSDLRWSNLVGAKIRDDITITKAPIQINGLEWFVTIWDEHMQIGCEFHSHDEWRNFSDKDWLRMGGKEALYLKREQFPMLIALCDQHKPKAEKTEAA